MRWLLALLFSLPLFVHATSAYRWIDDQGVTHFSDQPHPDAEKITVPETGTTYPARTVPVVNKMPPYQPPVEPEIHYSITLLSPTSEQAFSNGESNSIAVKFEIKPQLSKSDHVEIILDAQKQTPQSGSEITLDNLDRGAHTLRINVVRMSGNKTIILGHTQTINFYVLRTSLLSPARRNTANAIMPLSP